MDEKDDRSVIQTNPYYLAEEFVWSTISNASFFNLKTLVVKAFASRADDPGFESRLHRDFSGSSYR